MDQICGSLNHILVVEEEKRREEIGSFLIRLNVFSCWNVRLKGANPKKYNTKLNGSCHQLAGHTDKTSKQIRIYHKWSTLLEIFYQKHVGLIAVKRVNNHQSGFWNGMHLLVFNNNGNTSPLEG